MAMARSAAKLLIVLAVVAFVLTAWPQKATGEQKADGAALRLVEVQEVRRARLVGESKRSWPPNKPGLALTFEVTLPDGKQLFDIEQPEKIAATDSKGHDLTGIKNDFMGKKKYVRFLPKMDGQSKEFTLQLALPTRQATHFNVSTTVYVWSYHELTESVVTLRTKPVTLDAALFGGTKVSAVLRSGGIQTQLVLTPGTIKRFVEGITLSDGSNDYNNKSAAWEKDTLTYFFNTKTADAMTAKFTIRSGMSRMPCKVAIKNQPLP